MRVGYIAFLVFFFVVCQLSLIPLGNSSLDEEAKENLDTLSTFGIVSEEQTFGVLTYIKAPVNYFQALFSIATAHHNNPVFSGTYELFRWLVVAPLLAGLVFGLIVAFWQIFQRAIS